MFIKLNFNTRTIRILLVSVLAVSLSACQSYKEIEETQAVIEDAAAKEEQLINKLKKEKPRYRNVSISNVIFVPPVTAQEAEKPEWWFTPSSNKGGRGGTNVPFESAVNMIVGDKRVNTSYGRNIDRSKGVNFTGSTIGDAIDSIATASGYSYKIVGSNKIVWSMYETRTFTIAASPGTDFFGQGKGKGESDSTSKNINAESEYANAAGQYDILDEMYRELKTYSSFRKAVAPTINSYQDLAPLNPNGTTNTSAKTTSSTKQEEFDESEIPIFLNRSASTITVRDTPAVLDEMERIVKFKNDLYRTNIQLEIDIIEVKLSNEGQQAIDVSAVVKDISRYGLGLETGVTAGTAASQIGRASTTLPTNIIRAEITEGRMSGTELLVEALSSYGSVSARTTPRQQMQHNSIAKLRDIENVFFIEERAATNTANVGTELTIKQDNLDVGFALYAMSTVFQNDVTVRMATNLSSLIELTRNGDTGQVSENESATYVESPRTSNKDFMSKFTITSGDTLVLSGLTREIKTIRRGKGVSELLANSEFGKSERIETIITVRPIIYRPRS